MFESQSVPLQTFSAYPALPPPADVPLVTLDEHLCGYFGDRPARSRAFFADRIEGTAYHEFMNAGFRRSGRMIYQPVCRGCRLCTPIRIPVEQFARSKSQRRTWRRNADLNVEIAAPPDPTEEKFELYCRYLAERFGDTEDVTRASFVEFLYDSPVETLEFTYRDGSGNLLGVGLCDVCEQSLSSVYFYFDPHVSRRRGLGTFSSLWEIDFARLHQIPYYYLGYWITGCPTMAYKASFQPHELLCPDGKWRETSRAPAVENLR